MVAKLSVIVPVYNVEKYLKKCVDSILAQTYTNFEIILVDDGSKDSSAAICDEYATKNSKVIVIHKENGGLSDARNFGIEAAKGEFITYIDSDDWVHEDFLKNLYTIIIDKNADMAVCGVAFVYEGESHIDLNDEIKIEEYNGYDALEKMLLGQISQHGSSACGILYRTDLVKKYKFPYRKYHEDDFLTFKYYLDSKIVVSTSQKMYFYLQRDNSIMHRAFGQSFLDELEAADYITLECSKLGRRFERAANKKKFENYSQVFLENSELKKIDIVTYKRIKLYFNSIKFKLLFNHYNDKRMRLYAISIILGGVEFYRLIRKIIG